MSTPKPLDSAIADLVAAGRCWFTTQRGYRFLIGPADQIKKGAVLVVEQSGDRPPLRIKVTKINHDLDLAGKPYRHAQFRHFSEEIEANDKRPYRKVRSDMWGPGRQYDDEPGPTYYDDGSGTFAIQMWD